MSIGIQYTPEAPTVYTAVALSVRIRGLTRSEKRLSEIFIFSTFFTFFPKSAWDPRRPPGWMAERSKALV